MKKILITLFLISSVFVLAQNNDVLLNKILGDETVSTTSALDKDLEDIEKIAEEKVKEDADNEEVNENPFDGYWIHKKLAFYEEMSQEDICDIAEDDNYTVSLKIVQSKIKSNEGESLLINNGKVTFVSDNLLSEFCEEAVSNVQSFCVANKDHSECLNKDLKNIEYSLSKDLLSRAELELSEYNLDELTLINDSDEIICKNDSFKKIKNNDYEGSQIIFISVSDESLLNDLNKYIDKNCDLIEENVFEDENDRKQPVIMSDSIFRNNFVNFYSLDYTNLNVGSKNGKQCSQ